VPEIYIYEEGKEENKTKIWPAVECLPIGLIQETKKYIFEVDKIDDPFIVDLFIDDIKLEALRPRTSNTAIWRWSPGFYAGSINVRLNNGIAKIAEFEITTDPDLRKMSRCHFDDMIREILQDTYALFSLSGFRKNIARGVGKDTPPIARLEFLRSRISEIEAVIKEINRQPLRVLRGAEKTIPYYKATSITSKDLLRSFALGHTLKESNTPTKLPLALKGFLPSVIRQTSTINVLNIKENRNIKSCLITWSDWLIAVSERLQKQIDDKMGKDVTLEVWILRCRKLAGRLRRLLTLEMFLEIPTDNSPVVITPIYRNVPVYRKFFMLYRDINLGLTNIVGDFLQIPLARTFDLYELWCFFRIIRVLSLALPENNIDFSQLYTFSDKACKLTINSGTLSVAVGEHFVIAFQKNYREYWIEKNHRGSFSRTMIPDLSISHVQDAAPDPKLIILDSKYRIDEQLNSALASIHMYRDALVESEESGLRQIVSGAYIISPYAPDLGESDWKDTPMPSRLFHPEYRGSFKFGAVTLRPGMSLEEIRKSVNAIFADVGISSLSC